jgi:tetratricopeptide (TPR) repeat protein
MRHGFVAAGIVGSLILLIAACGPRDTRDGLSITERRRLTVDPRVGPFLLEAQQAYERGVYEMALAFTDSAERLAPDLADLHFLRGAVYTQLNQLPIAEAAYEVVLELDPAYPGAHYNQGLNASRRGKLRDAVTHFEAERSLSESSDLMLELGRVYSRLGEPDSARMAYERAIILDDSNATAYMWMGQLFEELGDFDRALEYSQKGLALRPGELDYQYIIGSLLYRDGQIEEALPYLEPVAEAQPWHHGAQFAMGQVLTRLGREPEAQRYFVQADTAQQRQQRVNELQEAINLEPTGLDNWVKLGTLLRESGRIELAIEAFKVATSLQPENLFLQSNLALLMMENAETDAAIRRFRAILSLDSTLADVWANLGVAYANTSRPDAAREAWETALRYNPGNQTLRAYLAELGRPPAR